MENNSRKIWEKPWDYVEGYLVAGGIAVAGFALQFSLGNVTPADFAFPFNIILGALFVIGLLCCHFFLKNNHIVRWLSGVRSTIPALVVMLVVIMLMGVLPQFTVYEPNEHLPDNFINRLGWYRMTTSWSFLLLSFYMLTVLGLATLRKTRQKPSWRHIGFYLNHAGLFIAFLAGIMGSADMQRLTMSVRVGQTEWRAMDYHGKVSELPIAIELQDFIIEEYEPKLVVINTETGRMLPEGRPDIYMYEEMGDRVTLHGNEIEVLEYLPEAAVMSDSLFATAVGFQGEGAATALKVRVTNPKLAEPIEGWVSNGSYVFPYKVLYIDDLTSVAMPVQEVKKYTSHVVVMTESGDNKQATIEVNKPLSIGSWKIYQFSYDESLGKYSKTSVFELVYDPWLKVVFAGIFMLLAGSMFLFIVGPEKKGRTTK